MSNEEIIRMLAAMPLALALWWFIENAPEDSSDVFFALRERVRTETEGN